MPGPRARRRTRVLRRVADTLLPQCDEPGTRAIYTGAMAFTSYAVAQFSRAVQYAQRAVQLLRDQCSAVSWELGNGEMVRLWSLYYLGKAREVRRRLWPLLDEARDRNNLLLYTNLCTTILNSGWLFDDKVDEARAACDEISGRWSRSRGFMLQHYWELLARAQADLYSGDTEAAWKAFAGSWRALRKSWAFYAHMVRVEGTCGWARAALAHACAHGENTAARRQLVARARQGARLIRRQGGPFAEAHAALLRAGATAADGGDPVPLLGEAIEGFDALDMAMHSACARHCLGRAVGGDEGAKLCAQADDWLTTEEIRSPERLIALLAPGF